MDPSSSGRSGCSASSLRLPGPRLGVNAESTHTRMSPDFHGHAAGVAAAYRRTVDDATGEALDGGGRTPVFRRGDVVRPRPGPWSVAVLDLLRHLEEAGFRGAPRVVGEGFDAEGGRR